MLSSGDRAEKGIKHWELADTKCSKMLGQHSSSIKSVSITPDCRYALSGSDNNTIKYWDVVSGECLATLKGHSATVRCVQITSEGGHAVSGSDDATIKIWGLQTGSCVGTLEGHQGYIYSVAISPDNTLVASTGYTDHTVRLWDWKSGICLQVIEDKEAYVSPSAVAFSSPTSVAFSADGRRLVVGTSTGPIYVYRLTSVKAASPAEATRRYVNAKVVLVGESGVGKSGLAHRLIEDKFVQTYSTHGMQVWRLDVPLVQQDKLEREVLLWDLAGQEDYRIIHQLFLDETTLAMMLINPQKDDPFAEVGDWLKALKAAVAAKDARRDVTKLLIAAASMSVPSKSVSGKLSASSKNTALLAISPPALCAAITVPINKTMASRPP
jgi:WD40 repeat protein